MPNRPEITDRVRTVWVPPNLYERIERFAAANAQSVSEVLRELMEAFANDKPLAPPARSTRRVSIWMTPQDYARFAKRRKESGITVAAAIERMLEDNG